MSAGALCVRSVETASPDETVRAVARRMARSDVGTVVVVGPERQPIGILTDRDIALRCVAGDCNPDATDVGELMSRPVSSIHEYTPIEDALSRMARSRSRRLVVVDDQAQLVGILALDDVVALLAEEVTSIGKVVRQRFDATGEDRRSA